MKKIRRALAALALSSFLSTTLAAAQAPVSGRPQSSPTRAASNFDSALRCMDDLLSRTSVGSNYYLVPIQLDDPGGKMGFTRDMIIAAASRMSEKSRFFTIVMKPPAQGAVFKTQGSITSLDQQVESKTSGTGLSIGNAIGGNAKKRMNTSNLSVTLYLVNSANEVVPGTFHSEQIALRTKSNTRYLGGSIGTIGGSVDFEASLDEGPQAAVRALVDLAMIEAVGALTQTPYGKCLAKGGADPLDRTTAWATFNAMKPANQVATITQAMVQRGLAPANPSPSQLRQAIVIFEREQGLAPVGKPSFEVFYALQQGERPTVAMNRPAGRGPAVKVSPASAAFFYEGQKPYPTASQGDKLAFDVTVAEPAYVACYYTDAGAHVTRVFPSAKRPAYRLAAGEVLRIPGDQDGFIIRPDVAQHGEWFTCMAGQEDFLAEIADAVPNFAMKPLPFHSAKELVAAAKQAAPNLSIDTLSYYVN